MRLSQLNKSSAIAEMAAQCCTSQILASGVDTCLMHCFSVTSENITNRILPKCRFFGLRTHWGEPCTEPIYSGLQNLVGKTRNIAISHGTKFSMNRLDVTRECDRQTDR